MTDDNRTNTNNPPTDTTDLSQAARNRKVPDSEDRRVSSVPLDTEDGETVVIEQQNVGPDNQVGGGEFKNVAGKKSVEQAAAEQTELDRER